MKYWFSYISVFVLAALNSPSASNADFFLRSPNNDTVAQCSDFATEVLKDPWDFSQTTDVPASIKQQQYEGIAEPLNFANGIFQFLTVSTNPHFSLLTGQTPGSIAEPRRVRYGSVFPIDSSRFQTASVRMFTDQDSFLQFYWEQSGSRYAITDAISTFGGEWRTYTVDLANVSINDHSALGSYQWTAGNPVQFRLDPTAKSGVQVKVDWMMLTDREDRCSQVDVNYHADSGTVAAIYIDDNQNLSDGYQQRALVKGSGIQTRQFSTARLFPGKYFVYGYQHTDFATLHAKPWDMDSSADIDTSRIDNYSSTSVSNSKFCGTTASDDANFHLKFPPGSAIDTDLFKYVTVKVEGLSEADISLPNVIFYDEKKNLLKLLVGVFDATTSTLQFDMAGVPEWAGTIHDLRIQVTKERGKSYCVDWVSVTPSRPITFNQDPTIPSLINAPGSVQISAPNWGSFVQPDNRGGLDCPTAYLGNPWTLGEQADLEGISNIENAQFLTYNSVTDSRGGVRIGDFLAGNAVLGNGDPKVHPLLFSTSIDADRCVHLCYSMILDRTPEIYHSVARVTYLSARGEAQDGDDVINPDRWADSDVCLYMKELQQEPVVPAGTEHPWRGKINFLSLDPHEDEDGAKFYIDYIELREDHKAASQFAVSVDAALSQEVKLYASTTKPSQPNALPNDAKFIGTLAAGRNTNTLVWNTSGEANGKRYISMELVGNGVVHAPLWVTIDNLFSDVTPPTVMIDSPSSGKKVTTSLQIAGAVFDNVRHAVTEAFIDDKYVKGIVPTLFHKGARETYPSTAPDKAGFNLFLDLSGYTDGNHTLKLVSYDTAGNTTTNTIAFTKGATADADVTYPDPVATPVPFGELPKKLLVKVVSGNNIVFDATGYEGCISTAIVAGKKSDLSDAITLTNGQGSLIRTATGIKQWTFGGAVSSIATLGQRAASMKSVNTASARRAVKKCKKGFRLKKVRKCRNRRINGRRVKVCTTTFRCVRMTPRLIPTPVPTPTPAPALEDGIIYFEARCNGGALSNRVSIDFGAEVTSTDTTIYETDILAQLQAKLSGQS